MDVPDERGEEMSDMIERDEVLAIIADLKKNYPTHSVPDAEAKVALRKVAEKIRAIDAVSVVHGEWIEHNERTIVRNNNFVDFFPTEYECSNCGLRRATYSINSPLSNYCPNCGAEMRKGADDE